MPGSDAASAAARATGEPYATGDVRAFLIGRPEAQRRADGGQDGHRRRRVPLRRGVVVVGAEQLARIRLGLGAQQVAQ